MVRSALLSVINQKQNISVGNTSIAERYMKGMFENNPTLLKFQFTCYVSLHFNSYYNMQKIQVGIRYPKINSEACLVDDTYLRWSEGPDHS